MLASLSRIRPFSQLLIRLFVLNSLVQSLNARSPISTATLAKSRMHNGWTSQFKSRAGPGEGKSAFQLNVKRQGNFRFSVCDEGSSVDLSVKSCILSYKDTINTKLTCSTEWGRKRQRRREVQAHFRRQRRVTCCYRRCCPMWTRDNSRSTDWLRELALW